MLSLVLTVVSMRNVSGVAVVLLVLLLMVLVPESVLIVCAVIGCAILGCKTGVVSVETCPSNILTLPGSVGWPGGPVPAAGAGDTVEEIAGAGVAGAVTCHHCRPH